MLSPRGRCRHKVWFQFCTTAALMQVAKLQLMHWPGKSCAVQCQSTMLCNVCKTVGCTMNHLYRCVVLYSWPFARGGSVNTVRAMQMQRRKRLMQFMKKADAVHAAAEHKIESIARAASCSTARQIMFEIKKLPTTPNSVQILYGATDCYGCFRRKAFRLLLCIKCNDC